MRIFASGAMDWVMGKALPDDVPIDSKMVTKAVERAQTTVEQKNAESRKNVLKYDEVMNEQRKVIYSRRNQILDGEDLRDEALERLAEAVDSTISTNCVSNVKSEWDLDGLMTEMQVMWDNDLTVESIEHCEDTDAIYDILMADGTAAYEGREEEVGAESMREIERQVMLRVLDTKWREHLYDMDYLKEGIHLRAMGQKDPLTEWQREGFEMFSGMLDQAAREFVAYIMHIEVKPEEVEDAPVTTDVQTIPSHQCPGAKRGRTGSRRSCCRRHRPEEGSGQPHRAGRNRRAQRRGKDAKERSLPLWLGQKIQAVPRPLGR